MRWKGRRESDQLEDRRFDTTTQRAGLPIPKGKAGIAVFIVVIVASLYGIDLTPLLNTQGSSPN